MPTRSITQDSRRQTFDYAELIRGLRRELQDIRALLNRGTGGGSESDPVFTTWLASFQQGVSAAAVASRVDELFNSSIDADVWSPAETTHVGRHNFTGDGWAAHTTLPTSWAMFGHVQENRWYVRSHEVRLDDHLRIIHNFNNDPTAADGSSGYPGQNDPDIDKIYGFPNNDDDVDKPGFIQRITALEFSLGLRHLSGANTHWTGIRDRNKPGFTVADHQTLLERVATLEGNVSSAIDLNAVNNAIRNYSGNIGSSTDAAGNAHFSNFRGNQYLPLAGGGTLTVGAGSGTTRLRGTLEFWNGSAFESAQAFVRRHETPAVALTQTAINPFIAAYVGNIGGVASRIPQGYFAILSGVVTEAGRLIGRQDGTTDKLIFGNNAARDTDFFFVDETANDDRSATVHFRNATLDLDGSTIDWGGVSYDGDPPWEEGDHALFNPTSLPSLVPTGTNQQDLGSAAKRWRQLFVNAVQLVGNILPTSGGNSTLGSSFANYFESAHVKHIHLPTGGSINFQTESEEPWRTLNASWLTSGSIPAARFGSNTIVSSHIANLTTNKLVGTLTYSQLPFAEDDLDHWTGGEISSSITLASNTNLSVGDGQANRLLDVASTNLSIRNLRPFEASTDGQAGLQFRWNFGDHTGDRMTVRSRGRSEADNILWDWSYFIHSNEPWYNKSAADERFHTAIPASLVPAAGTHNVGSEESPWSVVYSDAINVGGSTIDFTGFLTEIDWSTEVDASLIPISSDGHNLGAPSQRWFNAFVSNTYVQNLRPLPELDTLVVYHNTILPAQTDGNARLGVNGAQRWWLWAKGVNVDGVLSFTDDPTSGINWAHYTPVGGTANEPWNAHGLFYTQTEANQRFHSAIPADLVPSGERNLGTAAAPWHEVRVDELWLDGSQIDFTDYLQDMDWDDPVDQSVIPMANNAVALGSASRRWSQAHVQQLWVGGTQVSPSAYLTAVPWGNINADMIPAVSTRNVGSPTSRWARVYTDYVGGDPIGGQGGNLVLAARGRVLPVSGAFNNFGSTGLPWDIWADELRVAGRALFSGEVTLGNAATDSIFFTGTVDSNVLPRFSQLYNLGSNTARWAQGHFQTLTVAGQPVTGGAATVDWDTLDESLLPQTNNSIDLGSNTRRFRQGHFQQLFVNGQTITQALQGVDVSWGSLTNDAIPTTNNSIDIGSDERRWAEGHFQTLRVGGTAVTPASYLTSVPWGAVAANVVPSGSRDLGSSDDAWANAYFTNLFVGGTRLNPSNILTDMDWDDPVDQSVIPMTNNNVALGSASRRWSQGHFQQLFVDGNELDPADILTAMDWDAEIDSDLIPDSNNDTDLGSSARRWAQTFTTSLFSNEIRPLAGQNFMSVAAPGGFRPSVAGYDLGSTTRRWDAFLENVNIGNAVTFSTASINWSGVTHANQPWINPASIAADLIPSGSRDLGSSTAGWQQAHITQLYLGGSTTPFDPTASTGIAWDTPVDENIIPADNARSIGNLTSPFNQITANVIYASGTSSITGNRLQPIFNEGTSRVGQPTIRFAEGHIRDMYMSTLRARGTSEAQNRLLVGFGGNSEMRISHNVGRVQYDWANTDHLNVPSEFGGSDADIAGILSSVDGLTSDLDDLEDLVGVRPDTYDDDRTVWDELDEHTHTLDEAGVTPHTHPFTGETGITGTIEDDQIANNSISGIKIQDGSILAQKLAPGVITGGGGGGGALVADSVDTVHIVDDAVTRAKIADDAVGSNQIDSNAVTRGKIADDAVGHDQLDSDAVTSSNIRDGSVTNSKIASISAGKISGVLDYDQLPFDADDLGGGGGGGGTPGEGGTLEDHDHSAADIDSGVLAVARIPDLGASKITSGTFDSDRIPPLSAGQITSGEFSNLRIPNLPADRITSGTFSASRIPSLPAEKINTGVFSRNRIPDLDYADDDHRHTRADISGELFQSQIPNLNASKITAGVLNSSRIPDLNASKITGGEFNINRIPDLPASQITSGTIPYSRLPFDADDIGSPDLSASDIPNLPASKITSGTFSSSRIPNLPASKITSGTFNANRIPNLSATKINTGVFSSNRIPNLSASKITTGTMSASRVSGLRSHLDGRVSAKVDTRRTSIGQSFNPARWSGVRERVQHGGDDIETYVGERVLSVDGNHGAAVSLAGLAGAISGDGGQLERQWNLWAAAGGAGLAAIWSAAALTTIWNLATIAGPTLAAAGNITGTVAGLSGVGGFLAASGLFGVPGGGGIVTITASAIAGTIATGISLAVVPIFGFIAALASANQTQADFLVFLR